MSEEIEKKLVNRRDVLRSGAVVGGGLLATAVAGESVAAEDGGQTGGIGYITRSSYGKLTGSEDVDCVPNVQGWGGTFYVRRVAEDGDGDTGVSVEVPDPAWTDGITEQCVAYTITAAEDVELSGGPSGHGPWQQPCGSWLFVGDSGTVETDAVYRVGEVHSNEPLDGRYDDLTATDSDGDEIGSPMDLVCVSIERVIEQWPQAEKVTRGALDAGFGRATAIDGTTAVVSADSAGTVYVFTITDHGVTKRAELGSDVDIIGREVAISGETIVVDAPSEAVCVFTRSAGTWEKQATLAPDGLEPDDGFASSVDIDGDTAVVGAPEDGGATDDSEGSVYVFTRSDGTWSHETTLEDGRTAVDNEAEGLGYDVAVDGNTVVAGAPDTTHYGHDSAGGAFVFSHSDGEWTQQAFLQSDDGIDDDRQGQSVAVEDDTAVVASHDAHKESEYGVDAGAAWVYTRDGCEWSQQAKLTPDDWETRSWFGYSLSLDGDRLLVGADVFDGLGNDTQGSAYVFTREGTEWSQVTKLTADDGEPNDKFGSDVALNGTTALVCAVDERGGSAARSGSAYRFQR